MPGAVSPDELRRVRLGQRSLPFTPANTSKAGLSASPDRIARLTHRVTQSFPHPSPLEWLSIDACGIFGAFHSTTLRNIQHRATGCQEYFRIFQALLPRNIQHRAAGCQVYFSGILGTARAHSVACRRLDGAARPLLPAWACGAALRLQPLTFGRLDAAMGAVESLP